MYYAPFSFPSIVPTSCQPNTFVIMIHFLPCCGIKHCDTSPARVHIVQTCEMPKASKILNVNRDVKSYITVVWEKVMIC